MGDAYTSGETQLHNFDLAGAYTAWLDQIEDNQPLDNATDVLTPEAWLALALFCGWGGSLPPVCLEAKGALRFVLSGNREEMLVSAAPPSASHSIRKRAARTGRERPVHNRGRGQGEGTRPDQCCSIRAPRSQISGAKLRADTSHGFAFCASCARPSSSSSSCSSSCLLCCVGVLSQVRRGARLRAFLRRALPPALLALVGPGLPLHRQLGVCTLGPLALWGGRGGVLQLSAGRRFAGGFPGSGCGAPNAARSTL